MNMNQPPSRRLALVTALTLIGLVVAAIFIASTPVDPMPVVRLAPVIVTASPEAVRAARAGQDAPASGRLLAARPVPARDD